MIDKCLFECRRRCAIRHSRQRFYKLSFRTEEITEFVYIKIAEGFEFLWEKFHNLGLNVDQNSYFAKARVVRKHLISPQASDWLSDSRSQHDKGLQPTMAVPRRDFSSNAE